jgi:hypothetical protein
MEYKESRLPWTGSFAYALNNLQNYLSEHLPEGMSCYLPASITLFLDREIGRGAVSHFLKQLVTYINSEIRTRMLRQKNFVKLGLFSQVEIEHFLTARTHIQPWAIYYSRDGGLGPLPTRASEACDAPYGVIPCSSMKNHGVAWEHRSGKCHVWLATARKESQDWDWDSDIGHESAHAAFAPVPLFVQPIQTSGNSNRLSAVRQAKDLSSDQIARMIYFYSEIAVVTIRGEHRPTQTGLPIAETEELHALLALSEELMPNENGFEEALRAFAQVKGALDIDHGSEIYEIAAPILKLLPHLTHFVNAGTPPDLFTFQSALAQHAAC